MGWADCGNDSKGRPIGYAFEAICDQPGCNTIIDRGLSYACGGMHGRNDFYCEKYFCEEHLNVIDTRSLDKIGVELAQGQLCISCYNDLVEFIGEGVLAGDYKCEWVE